MRFIKRLEKLDPYSVDELMTAHGIMIRGLVEEPGVFYIRSMGLVDGNGHVLHFGILPQYVGTAGLGKNQRGTHIYSQQCVPYELN